MMTATRKTYPNLDLAKFVGALLIIIIHTAPLQKISDLANFYTANVLARIAVPLFFAISGFLFFGKLSYENGKIKKCAENTAHLIGYIKKTTLLYLAWSLIYIFFVKLPMWYQSGWWGLYVIKDCLAAIVFVGSHYHLWYLLALIYAVPVLYYLLRFIPLKKVAYFVVPLWLCECLIYSYAWIGIDKFPFIHFVSGQVPIIWDAFFRAVPLLAIGAFASGATFSRPDKMRCAAVGAFVLLVLEASSLYFLSPNNSNFSYLLFTPAVTFSLLYCLVYGKQVALLKKRQLLLRNMSVSIYCMHPLIMEISSSCNIPNGPLMWLAVTGLSIILAAGFSLIRQHKHLNRSKEEVSK